MTPMRATKTDGSAASLSRDQGRSHLRRVRATLAAFRGTTVGFRRTWLRLPPNMRAERCFQVPFRSRQPQFRA